MTKRVKKEDDNYYFFKFYLKHFIYNTFLERNTENEYKNAVRYHGCRLYITEANHLVHMYLSEWEPCGEIITLRKEDLKIIYTLWLCLYKTTALCKNMIKKICQCLICPAEERTERFLFTQKETWKLCSFIPSALDALRDNGSK